MTTSEWIELAGLVVNIIYVVFQITWTIYKNRIEKTKKN